MLKATIKLQSEYRRHGSAGPKPTKVKSTASAKFRALLNQKMSSEATANNGTDSETTQAPKTTRGKNLQYGSHSGNIQVDVLKEYTISADNAEQVTRYIQNVTSKFEARSSWDLRAAKHNYASAKDEILNRYQNQFGSNLSEKQTTNMLQELANKAFKYTSHQIIITLMSDTYIQGSTQSREDGMYYITIRSKKIYSENYSLLDKTVRDILSNMSDEEDIVETTTLVRVPAIILANTKGKLVVVYNGPQTTSGWVDSRT